MTKYVITPKVALRLVQEDAVNSEAHRLLTPTLLRSQLFALLFEVVGGRLGD